MKLSKSQRWPLSVIKLVLIFLILGVYISIKDSKDYVPELQQQEQIYQYMSYYEFYQERIAYFKTTEFNSDILLEYLKLRSVSNRDIILSKAMLETGNFSSIIFQESNNLFGMKYPLIRPTTAVGVNRGHAEYNHWTDSVDDYILWYNYVTQNRNYTDYYAFLTQVGYAEDPYYINKLKQIYANN